MNIFVTGDIHGNPVRLNSDSFYEQKEFSGNKDENIVIILGDFGLVWSDIGESKQEKYWLNWLENKPFTTVFVDGNHENFTRLYSYPVKKWCGGKVHEIRPHVLHLMRGEVFTIGGRKFFAFGGASSHDIQDGLLDCEDSDWKEKAKLLDRQGKYMYRIKGLSWWKKELPTKEEMMHGLESLKANKNKVDYIITHSPSTPDLYLMGGKGLYKTDVLTDYLEEVRSTTEYKAHLFGHMHVNRVVNDKDICLYEQIIRIV